jgi:hypothetical protein
MVLDSLIGAVTAWGSQPVEIVGLVLVVGDNCGSITATQREKGSYIEVKEAVKNKNYRTSTLLIPAAVGQ